MLTQFKALTTKGVESVSEASNETSIKSLKEFSPIKDSMELIENTSIESLKAINKEILPETNNEIEKEYKNYNNEKSRLSEEEKQQIKEETGWSDEIISSIGSIEEYQIYKNTGLQEVEINGRKCLVRTDIDWEQKDSVGRTNKERAEAGLSPINQNGDTIELHHIGQKTDSPLAELTPDEHRSKENYSILHDTTKESEIDRNAFNNERIEHWRERVNQGGLNA